MVPSPSLLETVRSTDLVGGLLVLWVVSIATLLTSENDPTAPPSWWAFAGLLLLLASVTVAFVLFRRAETRDEPLGQVWEASPECQTERRER